MEAGHAAQNLCLQAVVLELGSVVIGAFSDRQVGNMLQLGKEGIPLYIIPVGSGE
jgi:nitroreductase